MNLTNLGVSFSAIIKRSRWGSQVQGSPSVLDSLLRCLSAGDMISLNRVIAFIIGNESVWPILSFAASD